jgi:hypothetical protein
LTRKFEIKQHILAAEIIMHPAIFSRKSEKVSYEPFRQFSRIAIDLFLIVKVNEQAADAENSVMKAAQRHILKEIHIESLNIFDV